ncbi:MAG: zinc ribbon domain-containing protein [Tyzzerella sp.]|nr:zinc ribbon domain-containing protein [Tyzzerella sp.]
MDETACNRVTEEINAFPANELLKAAYITRISMRIKEIWEAEDFERYVEIYQATPVGDSAAVGRSCSKIQQIGRTELKEKFANALHFLNENEVATAAKYIVSKEGNAISALLNSGKKASYDILTIDGRVMHPSIERAVAALKEKKNGGFLSGLMGKRSSTLVHSAIPAATGSKFCSNCGNKLEQSAKFCPSCGAKQN